MHACTRALPLGFTLTCAAFIAASTASPCVEEREAKTGLQHAARLKQTASKLQYEAPPSQPYRQNPLRRGIDASKCYVLGDLAKHAARVQRRTSSHAATSDASVARGAAYRSRCASRSSAVGWISPLSRITRIAASTSSESNTATRSFGLTWWLCDHDAVSHATCTRTHVCVNDAPWRCWRRWLASA
jgi:hypothetical protein